MPAHCKPGGRFILDEHACDCQDEKTARWYFEQRARKPGAPKSLEACLAEWEADHANLHGYAAMRKEVDRRFNEHVDDQGWFFARIADQVAERRRQLGLSQAELAELVETTQSAVARLESGGRPPRIDTLLRIAAALDCELLIELQPRRARKASRRGR